MREGGETLRGVVTLRKKSSGGAEIPQNTAPCWCRTREILREKRLKSWMDQPDSSLESKGIAGRGRSVGRKNGVPEKKMARKKKRGTFTLPGSWPGSLPKESQSWMSMTGYGKRGKLYRKGKKLEWEKEGGRVISCLDPT